MNKKLIELLTVALCNQSVEEVADHLIANDVVPVVRCKDCKHYVQMPVSVVDYRCSIFCGCYDKPYPTEADDFCSYGERREGE